MEDKATQFWNEFEAETGERVEARAMGALFERDGDEQGLWGLLILTDKSFRFKHMPGENWLVSLLRMRKPDSSNSKPVNIVVPRSELLGITEPRRGFFARAFGPAFAHFNLTWREGEAEVTGRFQVDPSANLLKHLRGLLSAQAASPPV
jgi:hypothetical protein